jgi:hypothetical protein
LVSDIPAEDGKIGNLFLQCKVINSEHSKMVAYHVPMNSFQL